MAEKPQELIYIRNYDLANEVCVYAPASGEWKIVPRKAMSIHEHQLARGFYSKCQKQIIGVFAAENGPILFVDTKQFKLSPTNWQTYWSKESSGRHFQLVHEGSRVLALDYQANEEPNYFFPLEEDSHDFFHWLHNSREESAFYRYYTLA